MPAVGGTGGTAGTGGTVPPLILRETVLMVVVASLDGTVIGLDIICGGEGTMAIILGIGVEGTVGR